MNVYKEAALIFTVLISTFEVNHVSARMQTNIAVILTFLEIMTSTSLHFLSHQSNLLVTGPFHNKKEKCV